MNKWIYRRINIQRLPFYLLCIKIKGWGGGDGGEVVRGQTTTPLPVHSVNV